MACACGSPSSPDAPTEAQVIIEGSATWNGVFGNSLNASGGTGPSEVLNIGTGRQCAVVTKNGSSDITRQSRMTVRVADQRVTTSTSEFTETRTVCGTGRLR